MKEILKQLTDRQSSKRRSAAKKLRKLGDEQAGPDLLDALKKELRDVRTWETQYQMIMAIGECQYQPALPYLHELSSRTFEATMVSVALGDAIVRLSRRSFDDAGPILAFLESGNDALIQGGFQAMAMLRMVLDELAISRIIAFASTLELHHTSRFLVVVAASGWDGQGVETFLEQSGQSSRKQLIDAVQMAQSKKYYKWHPL